VTDESLDCVHPGHNAGPENHLLGGGSVNAYQQKVRQSYPTFDAREDFAFISFENYRIDGDSLLYSIDLSIRQGGALTAECRLPVADGQLGSPRCHSHH